MPTGTLNACVCFNLFFPFPCYEKFTSAFSLNPVCVFVLQEIAAVLIAFERHADWQSKEVKIRCVLFLFAAGICDENQRVEN